jgi:hypothetical protein
MKTQQLPQGPPIPPARALTERALVMQLDDLCRHASDSTRAHQPWSREDDLGPAMGGEVVDGESGHVG